MIYCEEEEQKLNKLLKETTLSRGAQYHELTKYDKIEKLRS